MDTKDKILQIGFNLFLERGYKEVSLKDISDAVGLTKGAFYHHFKSKEEMFRQIVDNYLLEGSDRFYGACSRTSLKQFMYEYLEALIAYMDNIQQQIYSKNNKSGISFYQILFDALKIFPDVAEKLKEIHESERKIWEEVINNAKAKGEIRTDFNSKQLAKTFISINDGLGMHSMLEGRLEEVHGEIFTAWNTIYSLIKT